MWSVVEKTALAEAEVEYEDYTSDTVWVKFPIVVSTGGAAENRQLAGAFVVIWTTTPWTIPGNRAISYSPKIEYGLYQVTDAPSDNWAKNGDLFVLADKLALDVLRQARVTAYKRLRKVETDDIAKIVCAHPLAKFNAGYGFKVPLLGRRSRHRRYRHRLRPHCARPRPRRLRRVDGECRETRSAGHQHAYPLHRRCRRPLHRSGAGLRRQARAHRQRREGRRQRGGDQGA